MDLERSKSNGDLFLTTLVMSEIALQLPEKAPGITAMLENNLVALSATK